MKAKTKGEKPVLGDAQKQMLGQLAGRTARAEIIETCRKAGLTVEKTARTVAEALDAKQVKVQLDINGKWQVSKEFTDHTTRLKAVEQAVVLLDLKPTEKMKLDVAPSLTDEQLETQINNLLKKAQS